MFADVKSTKTEKPDRSGLPVQERLHHRIIDGDRDGLTADLDEAMAGGLPALDIVNDVLLGGMKVVGELFGSGQMQLPFVLQSAETMKTAVAYLEPHMEKVGGSATKGKLVIATVKGDVHDIGKNLVDIICTNNGYEVHNLGIKVPISEMVAKVKEVEADALGMSGLLVKSTLIMRDNLTELNELGLTERARAARRRGADSALRRARPARAVRGSAVLRARRVRRAVDAGVADGDEAHRRVGPGLRAGADGPGAARAHRRRRCTVVEVPRRSPDVATDNEVFRPPFLGSRVVKGIGLDEIAEYVNETALYRNQWQFRPEKDDDGAAGERRRVQGTDPLGVPRAAGRGEGVRGARAAGRVRLLRRQRRWQRPGRLDRRITHEPRRPASRSRASRRHRSCASPTSSARSTPARSTTRRSTSSRWARP